MPALGLSLQNSSGAGLLLKPINWLEKYVLPLSQPQGTLIPRDLVEKLHRVEEKPKKINPIIAKLQSWFDYQFYLSSKFTRRPLELTEIQNVVKDSAKASVKALRPTLDSIPLNLYSIQPKNPSSISPITIFSGIKSSAAYKLDGLREFAEAGIPTRIANYRGFGSSYGQHKVSQNSIIEDGLAITEDLRSETADINLLGHSLGSALAAKSFEQLTRNHKINSCNMIVVSGWDDIKSVCRESPRLSVKMISWLLKNYAEQLFSNNWDTGTHLVQSIDNIVRNLNPNSQKKFRFILIHGTNDDLVSIHQARKLEAKLRTKIASLDPSIRDRFEVIFQEVPEAGHFNRWKGDIAIPYQFIAKILRTG